VKVLGARRPPRRVAPWGTLEVLAVAIAALSASHATADIFKCIGRDGHVTYSDAPCAGASSVRLDLKEPVEDLDPRRPPVAPSPVNRPAAIIAPSAVPRPTAVVPPSVTRPAVVAPNPVSRPTGVAPTPALPPIAGAPYPVNRPTAAAPNLVIPPAAVPPNALIPASPADLVAPVDRGSGIYELSYGDRQRIADLEQVRNASAHGEARESATLEISSIRRGTLARMSYDDLRRKDDYWGDLGSSDPDRRRVAAMQLADLLARYP
jgi:hypothetical protein